MLTYRQLACAMALAFCASAFAGCVSTNGKSRARAERVVKKKAKRDDRPGNFSLTRSQDIDKKLLRRGQAANFGSALDSY